MGSEPGSPLVLEDKAPEPPGWMIYRLSTSPHKQETRSLDTIQATSLLSRKFWCKWRFVKNAEIRTNPEKSQV